MATLDNALNATFDLLTAQIEKFPQASRCALVLLQGPSELYWLKNTNSKRTGPTSVKIVGQVSTGSS